MTTLHLCTLGLLAMSLQGCAQLGRHPDGESTLANPPRWHDEHADRKDARDAAEVQVKAYYAALTAAEAQPANQAAILALTDHGISVVDSHCLRWFQRLEEYDQAAAWGVKDFNVISQLGTALLGVARLSADVTTVYGAGMSAISGLQSNRQEGLQIAPASSDVKTKVQAVMRERATALRATPPATAAIARNELERYADLCTYHSARRLVAKALQVSEVRADADGQFRVTNSVPINYLRDEATIRLRKAWKPDGKTIDPVVDELLKAFLKKEGHTGSISQFLYSKDLAPLRERAMQSIDLPE